jgi:hypothetical protein
MRPSSAINIPLSESRGRRECRALGAPAALRAKVESTQASHHGHTGNTRHSLRSGFNGFFRALPGDRAFLPPSSAEPPANLTPASGCQNHTTSPYACSLVRLATLPRPPHPAPNVRDDREAPLFRVRDSAECVADLGSRSMTPIAADWHDGQISLALFTSPRLRGEAGSLLRSG